MKSVFEKIERAAQNLIGTLVEESIENKAPMLKNQPFESVARIKGVLLQVNNSEKKFNPRGHTGI